MRRLISTVFFACFSFTFIGCDDIFEEDISDDVIFAISPPENSQLEGNSVQFRWSPLEGADDYRIQIYGYQQKLVLDSLVGTTVFEYPINPGLYEWRVRGENFAYITPYTLTYAFSISASDDLTDQLVPLTSPANNVYSNNTEISFAWQGISAADNYHFQLLKKNGTVEALIYEVTDLEDTSLSLGSGTITEDSEYVWQVRAQNNSSNTSFFKRSIFIDRQNPPAPSLTEPTDGQNFNSGDEITFRWGFQDVGDVQSPIIGIIEISSDENFNTIVSNSTTGEEQYSGTFNDSGTFYWRVSGKDEANNTGEVSSSRSFIIN